MDLSRQTSANEKAQAAQDLVLLSSPEVTESISVDELEQPAGLPMPDGPPPMNCIWDSVQGCWVQKVNNSRRKQKKRREPQIIFKSNDTNNIGPPFPCPYPRKSGHTWNSNTGKWIKNTRFPCPYPRKSGHTWNSNTGKWIKNTRKISPKKTITYDSNIAKRTRKRISDNSIKKDSQRNQPAKTNDKEKIVPDTECQKKKDYHIEINIPHIILAHYAGIDGNYLSSAKVTGFTVEWMDGDTLHTHVKKIYYNPQSE